MSIEVRNINKRFGNFTALDDVSLTFPDGELVALLGPSGCGKTTLLRVIAGLEHADSGQILLDGEDSTDRDVRQRKVGFVFQHYALFKHMTVYENIAFGLRVRPRSTRPSEAEIRSASPWRARLLSSRASCYSTNRSARSMPRCARSCAVGSASCTTSCTYRRSS